MPLENNARLLMELRGIGVFVQCTNVSLDRVDLTHPQNVSVQIVSVASLRAAGAYSLKQTFDQTQFHDLGHEYCPCEILFEVCVACFASLWNFDSDGEYVKRRYFIMVEPILSKYVLCLDCEGSEVRLYDVAIDSDELFRPTDMWVSVPIF